jgi:hypothetical protein
VSLIAEEEVWELKRKPPTKLNLNLYLDKRLQCKSSTAVVNLILCENDTKHLLFLIKQILSSIFKILKALFYIETFVTFQKSGLELLKNLANVSVQKSAKTNFTPFSHLSALRVSTSLIFTAALCYLPCFIEKGLCFVVVSTNPTCFCVPATINY